MKRFRHLFFTTALGCVFLFSGVQSARANAIQEALLYSQQVMQYVNDITMDVSGGQFQQMGTIMSNLKSYSDKASSLLSKFDDASYAYGIVETAATSVSAAKSLINSYQYMASYTSELLTGNNDFWYYATKCSTISNYYTRVFKSISSTLTTSVKEIGGLFDAAKDNATKLETRRLLKQLNKETEAEIAEMEKSMEEEFFALYRESHQSQEGINNHKTASSYYN